MTELSLLKQVLQRHQATSQNEEDPFFVGDLGDVANKYSIWMKNLPRVKPFYAVKCNPQAEIISTLAKMGAGFDCSSQDEISSVLSCGVTASDIIYAHTCKHSSHLRYAKDNDVSLTTFDDEAELHKIKAIHPTCRLLVRILPFDLTKSKYRLDRKAGCRENYAKHLLSVAKRLELNVVGVCFHVGSGCSDADVYMSTLESAHRIFVIAKDLGYNFNILDIGGGFPGLLCEMDSVFTQMCTVINKGLAEYFPKSSGIQVIAEPGRYFVGSAFTLLVNVIGKRTVQTEAQSCEQGATVMYFLSDGFHGGFQGRLTDLALPILSTPDVLEDKKYHAARLYESCLVGPTCDSADCILDHCLLPDLDWSDWLVFRDMGAYTICMASGFNGFPKPTCYFIGKTTVN